MKAERGGTNGNRIHQLQRQGLTLHTLHPQAERQGKGVGAAGGLLLPGGLPLRVPRQPNGSSGLKPPQVDTPRTKSNATAATAKVIELHDPTASSTDKKRELILGGTITDLDKTNLNSNNRGFTLGSTLFQLGQTKTDIDGISGLQFSNPSNKNPFANVGANDLTIGVGNGTVKIPGNLEVEGTASFTNSDNVRVKDKVITIGDGSNDVTGGIFIQQSNPSGFLVGNAFILKQDSTYGTYDGRWGFLRSTNVTQIENGTEVPTGAETKPWSAIVTVTTDGTSPAAAPKFGGSSKGHGNLHVDTAGNGRAYVYI